MRKARKTLLTVLGTLAALCVTAGIGVGMQASAFGESIAPSISFKEGASVRLHATSYGIRFTSVIDNYDADYTYGMYIFPTEYLDDYTSGSIVEHAKSKAGGTLAGGECTTYLNGSTYQMNGALTGLKYNNLNREWIAIAYAQDGGGNVTYSELSDSRNIVWVSGAALEDEDEEYTTTEQTILDNFIKLGYHQAIGTEEAAAKASNQLPAISVSGEMEVYRGLWANPAPTFTYNGVAVANAFNPYVSVLDENSVSYWQKNVRSFVAGEYTLGYENITGTYTVKVREFDETLNSAYFGIYDTVVKDSAMTYGRESLFIAASEDAEVALLRGENSRRLLSNVDYTVNADGISIAGTKIDYFGGPSDLVVCEDKTATIYRVAYLPNFFDPALTQSKTYVLTNVGRNTVDTGDRVALMSKYDGDINARYAAVGIDIEYLKLAAAEGYYAVEFDVQVDDTYAAYAKKGLRVYASTQSGNTVDGGLIQAGTAGVTLYQDFGTDVTEAGIFTVKIVLKNFLALDENAKQFRFIISGAAMNPMYFSDFRLRKTATQEDMAEALGVKYGFVEKNVASTANGGIWEVSTGSVLTKTWDATENGMKVNMVNANANISARDFVMYTSIDMLKDAQAAGFNTVTFDVSSADGAFTAEGRGLRIFSKQNAGRDTAGITTNAGAGIYEYADFGLEAGTTEFTVAINIEDFLALNASANYVGIVLNMPSSTNAYFSNLQFTNMEKPPVDEPTEEPTVADQLAMQYGFTETNVTIWSATSGGVFSRVWDASANALKVNMVNTTAAINGRYFVMYRPINMLKDAQAAGMESVSFKVTSADGAFTDAGRGLRIYSKQNSGVDGVGIDTNASAGVYVYGDFGTAAGTTEFTVTINIADFLALNPNAGYLGIVLNMVGNTNAYFSDMQFTPAPTVEEQLEEKYGFVEKNVLSTANGGIWDANTGGIFGKSWDASANAMKVSMVNTGAQIAGRDFVMYTSINMLKDAQAAGFVAISFKVSSADGAFTADGRGLRVYSKQNAGRDTAGITTNASAGIYQYADFGTAADTTEFMVIINVDEFLALNANANYLAIVLNMPGSTSANFSDLQFISATEEEIIAQYNFSEVNTPSTASHGIWDVNTGSVFGKAWDASANAMKVSMVNTGAQIAGRDFVMYTSISVLKKANAAGIEKVYFTVSSPDGAFLEAGRGIRVYSKQNAGRDGAAITISEAYGIYTYADFGTDLNVTKFTVEIDIADFLALNANANYIGIVLNMPANTTAYFSNLRFEQGVEVEEEEPVSEFVPYTIVYTDNASKVEKLAASELAKYLSEATGETFNVSKEGVASQGNKIYLGQTTALSAQGVTLDEEALNGDGFVIFADGDMLYIAGATDKGTLYGVYYYLEEYIGVRFYTLDSEYIPSVDQLDMPTGMVTEIPAFRYRGALSDATMHVNIANGQTADVMAEFYAKTRQSHEFLVAEAQAEVDKYFGGSIEINKSINQAHNNLIYVPVAEYYESNTSMFYVKDGKPVDICYSNGINTDGSIKSGTNAASVFVESLKAQIIANPNAEYHMLGQEDLRDHCSCANCLLGATSLFGYGSYTAIVLRFYNAVAKAIAAWEIAEGRTPVKLVCYSYLFTVEAPVTKSNGVYVCHDTVKLADNLIVRFADINANCYYSFIDAAQSGEYGADYLEKWAAVIGDNDTWYWGYATHHSYYFTYTPSLQKVQMTLQALQAYGTEYAFYQHSTSESNDWRAMMETYVISKMLWNPNQDVTAIRNEYLEGYYGVASDKIISFVDNFDDLMAQIAATTPEYFMTDIMSGDSDYKVQNLITKAFLESQLALLDEAIAAINASDLSSTEKAEYIARINAVKATPMFYLAYAAEFYYTSEAEITAARKSFVLLCGSVGITAYGEHKQVSALAAQWGV